MRIIFISGDELFSDTYKMKLVDDCLYEVYGKVRVRPYLFIIGKSGLLTDGSSLVLRSYRNLGGSGLYQVYYRYCTLSLRHSGNYYKLNS